MSNLTKATHKAPSERKHLYIATPAMALHSNYLMGLVRSIPLLLNDGVSVTYALLMGHCHVDDARNLLVADFLKTTCTDLLFWDADVGAQPDAALRLLSHDAEVVGGAYPLKQDRLQFPIIKTGAEVGADGLLEVWSAPTGFLKISRAILQRLSEQVAHLGLDGTDAAIIFERSVIYGNQRVGGDVNFCRQCIENGKAVYVDPSLLFTHQGTKDYAGKLGETLLHLVEAAE